MPETQPPGASVTVLFVEDNADNRGIYRTILEHSGFEVLEAEDGASGVRIAKARKPSLILMDVSLPIMDGWEATRILKQDPSTSSIPIVALTAHALHGDRERAAAAGCDGYIPKPAPPRDVLEEVKRRLGLSK